MKLTWGHGVVTSGNIGQGVHIKWLPLISGTVHDMQRVDMVLGRVGEPSPLSHCGVWLGRHLSIRREVAFSPGPLVGRNMQWRG